MEIKQIFTTSIRLVRLGENPFFKLLNKSKAERINETFRFTADPQFQQTANNPPLILFRHGMYRVNDEEVAIPRLQIEARKFIIDVTGSSADADAVYLALFELLVELIDAPRNELLQPMLNAEESTIVSNLEFPPEALFAEPVMKTVKSLVEQGGEYDFAKTYAQPATINFIVEHLPIDHSLNDMRIGLTRKELSIGPKGGYPPDSHIYESKAPFNSDLHIQLLEKLEQALTEGM